MVQVRELVEGGGGSSGGATSYDSIVAAKGAVGALPDGTIVTVGNLEWWSAVSSGEATVNPLVDRTVPTLTIGKDATNGYDDQIGTSSENSEGIFQDVGDAGPTNDDSLGEPAATWPRGKALLLPLGALDCPKGCKLLAVRGTFDVQNTVDSANEEVQLLIGLYKSDTVPGASVTGVTGGTYRFSNSSNFRASGRNYDAGSRTTGSDASALPTDYEPAASEMQVTVVLENYGENLQVRIEDASGNVRSFSQTLAGGHAMRTHLLSANPEITLSVEIHARGTVPASALEVTCKDLKVVSL